MRPEILPPVVSPGVLLGPDKSRCSPQSPDRKSFRFSFPGRQQPHRRKLLMRYKGCFFTSCPWREPESATFSQRYGVLWEDTRPHNKMNAHNIKTALTESDSGNC